MRALRPAFALSCVCGIALSVASPGAGVEQRAVVHGTLPGRQISLTRGEPHALPAGEPAYVIHGWSWPLRATDLEPGWLELLPAEQRERASDDVWRLELYLSVNGGPVQRVELKRSFHFIGVGGNPHFTKVHYLEIPARTYAPQTTVTFTGVWYGDSDDDDLGEVELTRTLTVTFT